MKLFRPDLKIGKKTSEGKVVTVEELSLSQSKSAKYNNID